MPTSSDWVAYFEENARSLLPIPWDAGAELTADEVAAVAASVREFQVGEQSEGKHLFRYAQDYADRTGDADYLAALRLFIREEQRHARDLGRFLTLNGVELARTTFTDRWFRRARNLFGGLESSIAVLVGAEVIAKVYYAALHDATNSTILRRLCEQILRDEDRHVEFQAGQLARLRSGRGPGRAALSRLLQRGVYLAGVAVLWLWHRRVLRRAGLTAGATWRWCWREYAAAFAAPTPLAFSHPAGKLYAIKEEGRDAWISTKR